MPGIITRSIGKQKELPYASFKCDLFFEASVAGGIPIIRPLKQCLAANRIIEIMVIINGTTNYILSKMMKDGSTFKCALQEAQELGYAEADATADIGGFDAAQMVFKQVGFEPGGLKKVIAAARLAGASGGCFKWSRTCYNSFC